MLHLVPSIARGVPAAKYTTSGGFSHRHGVQSGALVDRPGRRRCRPPADPELRHREHRRRQAARVSDYTGFMLLGVLKEFGTTKQIFTNPKEPDTENYISGRFG